MVNMSWDNIAFFGLASVLSRPIESIFHIQIINIYNRATVRVILPRNYLFNVSYCEVLVQRSNFKSHIKPTILCQFLKDHHRFKTVLLI
jgi:hypothetical protein